MNDCTQSWIIITNNDQSNVTDILTHFRTNPNNVTIIFFLQVQALLIKNKSGPRIDPCRTPKFKQ